MERLVLPHSNVVDEYGVPNPPTGSAWKMVVARPTVKAKRNFDTKVIRGREGELAPATSRLTIGGSKLAFLTSYYLQLRIADRVGCPLTFKPRYSDQANALDFHTVSAGSGLRPDPLEML